MKRTVFFLVTLMLVPIMLFSQGATEQDVSKPIVMKVATEDPAGAIQHPAVSMIETFIAEVEKNANGRIVVEYYPNRQLGTGESILTQLRNGLVQVSTHNDGVLSSIYPPLQVAHIPYVFASRELAWKVLDGQVGKELMDDMAKKTGVRILSWTENGGFRHYTNNKREIRTPKDMVGIKMRTMNVPLHMQIVRDLGASPTPISWAEVYSALQTGVADGQENSITTMLLPKLEEVQKYIALDGHVYGIVSIAINDAWFQGLPADLKHVIINADLAARAANRKTSVEQETIGLEYLKSKGNVIYETTFEDKELFRAATQDSAIAFLQKDPNVGPVWVEKMLKAVDAAEREMGLK